MTPTELKKIIARIKKELKEQKRASFENSKSQPESDNQVAFWRGSAFGIQLALDQVLIYLKGIK